MSSEVTSMLLKLAQRASHAHEQLMLRSLVLMSRNHSQSVIQLFAVQMAKSAANALDTTACLTVDDLKCGGKLLHVRAPQGCCLFSQRRFDLQLYVHSVQLACHVLLAVRIKSSSLRNN